jgi:hypothetical protein
MVDARTIGRGGLTAVALGLSCLAGGEGRADRIIFRGGGQIKGVIVPGGAPPDQVLVLTETLATPLKYRKAQIVRVDSEPTPLRDYLAKRDKAAPTAAGQFELGSWCEEHKLPALAELHYRRALDYDKTFAPAHKKLGHVLYDNHWVTRDELRAAQGLVKYKGRWVSKDVKENLEAAAAAAAERVSWSRRLTVLRKKLLYGDEAQRKQAEEQLAAIHEPAAVNPLLKVFGQDPEPLRILLAQTLSGIKGTEAAAALVQLLLAESETSVREATMKELANREERNVIPLLVKALRARDMRVVNRAAWALGNLNAVTSVPKLISALVVVDEQIVWNNVAPAGGGGLGVSFSSVGPGLGPGMGSATGLSYGGGSFASGTIYPWPVLTPPVVAPGAVAFGGTSLGYSGLGGAGFGLGLGSMPARGGPQPQIVRNVVRNAEVLNALIKLTGQDFGYDVETWRHWVNTAFRTHPTPARRVPQP